MSLISTIIFHQSKIELQQRLIEKLNIINDLKIERIKSHFGNVNKSINQIEFNSDLELDFLDVVHLYSSDPILKSKAEISRVKLEKVFSNLEKTYNFNRICLRSLEGYPLVESRKISNLLYNDSLLYKTNAHTFIDAQKKVEYSDIYHASAKEDDFYLTVLSPYYTDKNQKEAIAIICCEIPMSPIYEAVEDTTGLGVTGETILTKRTFNKMHFISRPRGFIGDFLKKEYLINRTDKGILASQMSVLNNENEQKYGFELPDFNNNVVDASWNFIPGIDWGVTTKIDHKEAFASINYLKAIIILLCSGILFFSVLVITIFVERFLTPIISIRDNLVSLAKGKFPKHLDYEMSDEIHDTTVALNNLVERLKNSTDFAQQIGEGNLNAQFHGRQSQDVLTASLLRMQQSLKRIEEENNRRKWATEGLSLHNEIFRKNNTDLNKIGSEFILSLVQYISGIHGAIYVVNHLGTNSGVISLDQDNTFFEMIGSYAYEIKEDTTKKFRLGQGLVGQSAKEKKTIIINDEKGTNGFIVSGLGRSLPCYVYCVPMILNKEVLGVVEISNFKELPKYVIEFIELLGESFASAVLSIKSKDQTMGTLSEFEFTTSELLHEQEEISKRYKSALTEIKALKEKINMLEKNHEDLN